MADNLSITQGSGTTIAADDISGVLYQRVKISQGADGSATDVSSAAPLQVSLANTGANATAVKVDGSAVTQPVSLASVPSHAVTNAGTFAVQATLDAETTKVIGTVNVAAGQTIGLAAGTAGIGKLTANSGVDIGDVDILSIAAGDNNIGNVDIVTMPNVTIGSALPAGTNAIGKLAANSGVDIGDVDVTSISAGSNLIGDANLQARTGGGSLSIFRSIDLDESEEEIKGSAGALYGYYFANTNAAARYLKFYNATAANVTVGTTTPVLTFYLPPTVAGHISFAYGVPFDTAITAAATTGVADNDTGAPGANEVILNAFYK